MQFRSKTFNIRTSNGTNLVCTEPAGAVAGDILLMWFTTFVGAGTITAPTGGWAQAYSNNDTDMAVRLWWIRRGASAPGLTPTWASAQSYAEAVVLSYQGAIASGTPYEDVQGNPVTSANPCNPDPPSATSLGAGRIAIALGASWQGAAAGGWTAPSGYTGREVNSTAGQSLSAADKAVGAGAENPGAFTNGDTTANNANGVTMILVPPSVAAASLPHPSARRLATLMHF